MNILPVTEQNIDAAALVHALSWRESHRAFCSPEFVALHTPQRQREYLSGLLSRGTRLFLLTDPEPAGIVSVSGSLIADLYVLPDRQNRGYGTALLSYAVRQCDGTPTLWILENNERAEKLYLKNGFRRTGNRNRITDGLDEIELAISVHEPAGL